MKIAAFGQSGLGARIALGLGLALTLSACGSGSGSAESESNDLGTRAAETLEVGIDLTYPPYDMLKDGKPAGFDVELVDQLAEKLDVKPVYRDTRFAQIIAGVKAGRYDMVASTLYISAERAEQVDFVPYFQTGNSIIVKAGGAPLATPEDLCGKKVSVVTATVIAKKMRGAESAACKKAGKGAIQVKEYPTDPEASQALLAGQVDAQMTDAAVAKTAVDSAGDRLELSSNELVYPVAVGLGVKKGNDKLKDAIEKALEELQSSGSYDKLLEAYNLEPVDDDVLATSLRG